MKQSIEEPRTVVRRRCTTFAVATTLIAGGPATYTPRPRTRENDMLTNAFPFLLPSHIELDLPDKMRRLGDDLERLRSGTGPTDAEIAAAPLIDDWHAVLTPTGLRLTGFVSGHPGFGNRSTIISQLWAADAGGRWVRTLSRFYRLGRAADGDIAHAGSRRPLAGGAEGMLSDV